MDRITNKVLRWLNSFVPKHPAVEDGVIEFREIEDGIGIRGLSSGLKWFAEFLCSLKTENNAFDHLHIEPEPFGNFPCSLDSDYLIIGNAMSADSIEDLTPFQNGLIQIFVNKNDWLLIEGLSLGFERLGKTISNLLSSGDTYLELTPDKCIFDGKPLLSKDSGGLSIRVLNDELN